MASYDWRAVEPGGGMTTGRLEAASPEQAMQQLKGRGLVPVAVTPAGAAAAPAAAEGAGKAWSWRASKRVTRDDVLRVTHELAVMLRAGLPLAYALRVLLDMTAKPPVQSVVQQLLDDVKGGAPLSRALGRHGGLFGDFYVQMVRAGEAAGQLAATLERLAEHLARNAALRESVISAATYPMVLLGVALLSLVGMIGFVVPQFEKLFADMGDAVPLPTRIVLAFSHHVRDWGWLWALVLVAGGVGAWRWLRRPEGRTWWQTRLLRLPLFGPLVHGFQVGLFARTLGTLVSSGVPLLGALGIAVDTVANQPLRESLRGLVMPVKSGQRLAQAMADTQQFEPLAVNLVRVGEETGRLGALLLELARVTDQRVETGIKRLLALLEPVLIVVLGVVIAGIIVSILLGILSVNEIAA